MTGLFHAEVSPQGKLQLHDREAFFDHVAALAGKRIELRVGLPKKRGSDNQQKYYFGVLIARIMEEIGEHGNDAAERIHDALMRRYFPVEKRGEIEIRRSYGDLDSLARERYHESIRIDASTGDLLGSPVWLPLPNEAEAM